MQDHGVTFIGALGSPWRLTRPVHPLSMSENDPDFLFH